VEQNARVLIGGAGAMARRWSEIADRAVQNSVSFCIGDDALIGD
jgi:hypothetical protein